jgi:heme-degrading monooxygenase HmoA
VTAELALEQAGHVCVLQLRSLPGRRGEVELLYEKLKVIERSLAMPGARSGLLLKSLHDPDELMVVTEWDSETSYRGWSESADRRAIVEALEPLLAEPLLPAGRWCVAGRVEAAAEKR